MGRERSIESIPLYAGCLAAFFCEQHPVKRKPGYKKTRQLLAEQNLETPLGYNNCQIRHITCNDGESSNTTNVYINP